MNVSYQRVLDFLSWRKQQFTAIPQGAIDDLAKFCRAEESTWDEDPARRDVLIGRREVWLRIQQHRTKTPQQLAVLYGAPNPDPEEPAQANTEEPTEEFTA